jgi:hypothetical protein
MSRPEFKMLRESTFLYSQPSLFLVLNIFSRKAEVKLVFSASFFGLKLSNGSNLFGIKSKEIYDIMVSISSTFYEQFLHTKVLCAAFSSYVMALANIRLTLMKLTPKVYANMETRVNFTNSYTCRF